MATPSLAFLTDSVAVWRTRLVYRQRKLNEWRRKEKAAYQRWQKLKASRTERDPDRVAAYRAFEQADQAVDKWQGNVDEAKAAIAKRRRQIRRHGEQASEHFNVSEFDCHDGTRVPKAAYPALRRLCEDVLEPMRAQFGACHVTSGYRHRSYNASIGGASQSQHIYDDGPDSVAADVSFARGNPAEWARFARGLGKGGVGQYDRSGFVHVDNGPRRDWWG